MSYYDSSNEKVNIIVAFIISSIFVLLGAYHAYLAYQFKYYGTEKTIFIEKLINIETRANRVIYYTYKILIDENYIVINRYYELPVNTKIYGIVIKNKDSISITQGRKSDSLSTLYLSVAGGTLLSVLEMLIVTLVIIVWSLLAIIKLKNILISKSKQRKNP